jgi:hypothetical protein
MQVPSFGQKLPLSGTAVFRLQCISPREFVKCLSNMIPISRIDSSFVEMVNANATVDGAMGARWLSFTIILITKCRGQTSSIASFTESLVETLRNTVRVYT